MYDVNCELSKKFTQFQSKCDSENKIHFQVKYKKWVKSQNVVAKQPGHYNLFRNGTEFCSEQKLGDECFPSFITQCKIHKNKKREVSSYHFENECWMEIQ